MGENNPQKNMVCCRRSRSFCCKRGAGVRSKHRSCAPHTNDAPSSRLGLLDDSCAPAWSQAAASALKDLTVDGFFGKLTTMALQAMLTHAGHPPGPIDGRFGRKTKKAMKSFLNAQGYELGCCRCSCWGRRSTRALQTWLHDQGGDPGPIDGRWGCRTTKGLQNVLNAKRVKSAEVKPAEMVTKELAITGITGEMQYKPSIVTGQIPVVEVVKASEAAGAA